MMHEKQRITWTGKKVGHLAADGDVTTAVHALHSGNGAEVDDVEKRGDIGLTQKYVHRALLDGWASYCLIEITAQTMWFVG